ncbi:MAG: hypothetical protein DRI61_06955 [Chloroflexi bacterium]|nr:MAG: hypothetical protein DRI61_06955 [Chloroflexota bacterium]
MTKTNSELKILKDTMTKEIDFISNRLDTMNLNSTEVCNHTQIKNILQNGIEEIRRELKKENKNQMLLNYVIECPECCEKIRFNDIIKHDDSYYCESCFDEKYTICSICEDTISHDDKHTHDDKNYCQTCFNDNFIICESCEDTIHVDNSRHGDGSYYCEDCFFEVYTYCESCGDVVHSDCVCYNNNDESFCEDCYCDRNFDEFSTKNFDFENNTFDIVKSSRCFGIELELSNQNIDYEGIESSSIFGCKNDCSLNYGAEFYSPILQGDKGLQEVKKFYSCIENDDNDESAGLHMHVDMREDIQNISFIKTLMFFYNRVEKIIYKLIDDERQYNTYCKPLRQNDNDIQNINSVEDLRNFHCEKLNRSRYFGFNIDALYVHKTIELRYREGITRFVDVKNWIKLNLYIFDYCQKNSFERIKTITSGLNTLDKFITFLGVVSNRDYELIGYWISVYNKNNVILDDVKSC